MGNNIRAAIFFTRSPFKNMVKGTEKRLQGWESEGCALPGVAFFAYCGELQKFFSGFY